MSFVNLKERHQRVGRLKLHFKNTIKRNLARKGIPPGSWDKKADNRPLWRDLYEGSHHQVRCTTSSNIQHTSMGHSH